MENRSFEDESESSRPAKDPMDNPPGVSNPLASPSREGKDQPKEKIPPLARITDDEDDDSPPAYAKRYMPQEKKEPDLDLELPPAETVEESLDPRLDPELQLQANKRRARRSMQNLVEGPCSLRPDSPNLPPLPEPQPYPDLEQEPVNASDTARQVASALPCSVVWRERCSYLWKCICSFSFQFPLHTLLLTWPLMTATLGALNPRYCPLNDFLPYVMLGVGLLGTPTVLFRLYTMYHEKRVAPLRVDNYWIGVRVAEFIIWDLLTVQLYYFFEQAPSFKPGTKRYCKPRFYKINRALMFVSSVVMIGWIIVHIGNFIYWLKRRNERLNNSSLSTNS